MSFSLAMYGISWDALYDIHVDMKSNKITSSDSSTHWGGKTHQLVDASRADKLFQDRVAVALTLETVTPAFGVGLSQLHSWNLSIHRPTPTDRLSAGNTANIFSPNPLVVPPIARAHHQGVSRDRSLVVSSKGDMNATFEVLGFLAIPSDDVAYSMTIAQLGAEGQCSAWQYESRGVSEQAY